MDRLTLEQRRKNMKSVRASGTVIETLLAKALFRKGFRYRKNDRTVFGKPDLTFKKHKVAIFVDGEFWHGKDWQVRKFDHKSNHEFWHKKIERNIQRDKEVNERLKADGWKVLRFWGKDVIGGLEDCIHKIQETIYGSEGKDINRKV